VSNGPKAIKIGIDVNGELAYQPPHLHAKHGDAVTWTCDDSLIFAIQFLVTSPLTVAEFRRGDPASPVRTEAAPGSYSYAVAVSDGKRVYLDASCPVIIID